jgi:sulfur-carrier protein
VSVITLRYWAAAKAAAGVAEDRMDVDTLAAALECAAEAHGEQLARVLTRCSFLVDGNPVGARPPETLALPADAIVEALPPFAGG